MEKIIKINNTLAVEIRHFVQEKTMFKSRDVVQIEMAENNDICIKRHGTKMSEREKRLQALLSCATPANLY